MKTQTQLELFMLLITCYRAVLKDPHISGIIWNSDSLSIEFTSGSVCQLYFDEGNGKIWIQAELTNDL